MGLIRRAAEIGGTVGAAVALGALASCGVAEAKAPSAHLSVLTPSGVKPASVSTDPYSAGYFGPSAATATLSGTVTVPTVKCTSKTNELDYLGFFLNGETASDQPTASGADIYLQCASAGGDTLSLATEDNSSDTIPVEAGDQIAITVSVGSTSDTETYDDLTSGATASATGTGFTSQDYQLTVQGGFDDGGVFPGFSAIKFKSVMVDGGKLSKADPGRSDEVNSSTGKKEINTSTISAGTNFSETFVSG
jgi:hypothetical protein